MREKKIRANQTRKKDKHQVHCVGLHSAEHTHTHTHKQIKQQEKMTKRKKKLSSRA